MMLKKMGGVGLLACGILLLCAVSSVNSYSKYGRGCNDIGCLPNEECVISTDSCSYSQRDGKDCGSYPTCKKKSGVSTSSSSSSVNPSAPSFQQFPQPNHPGSVLNPGVPQGLQPVNPYNPPFVFGQQPFYNAPGGTGGPPGGSAGILGGSGGGLAPYPGGYPSPNMYNKPPPQYQNQNPYNRQTQTHPSAAGGLHTMVTMKMTLTFAGLVVLMQKLLQFST